MRRLAGGATRAAARRRVLLVASALAAGLALDACTEAKTGPDTPVAIAFDSLPWPSIVLGDTLRDANGEPAPLRATVYNGDGDVIDDAAVRWFVLTRDTLGRATGDTVFLEVDSLTGIAVAVQPSDDSILYRRRSSAVAVAPQAGSLPGPSRLLQLTLRPDSLAAPERIDTAGPSRQDTSSAARVSRAISGQVLHDSAGLGTTFLPVRAWIVDFAVEYRGVELPVSSRTAWIVDETFRPSSRDTTDAAGSAARRVAINPDSLEIAATGGTDSLVVLLRASWARAPLRGSPARVVVPIRIAPPATR